MIFIIFIKIIKYITGYKDTDYELLMKLNDHELGVVCQSNKKIKQICDDENFWMNRSIKFYNISASRLNRLKRFLEFTDSKKLYMNLKDKREQVRLYAFEKSGSEDYA